MLKTHPKKAHSTTGKKPSQPQKGAERAMKVGTQGGPSLFPAKKAKKTY